MSNHFKQYNPEIIWNKLQWRESTKKDSLRRIHRSMDSLWVIQKDYNLISSTNDNLYYWLIPSYSPLYNNGQIKLNNIWNLYTWEIEEKLKIIFDYLKIFKGDLYDLKEYSSDITLISQFSWLMIKDIISWNVLNNEYILWRLFRKQSSSRIKEYYQLETVLKDYDLKRVIDFLEIFITKTINENFTFSWVVEKSFPFVSPWFEFSFTNWWSDEIKIVWWYVDNELLSKFWMDDNYFIFWANINKFSDENINSKRNVNRNWKDISIKEDIWKILSFTSDVKKINENTINIQPNKIELLLKNRLNSFLGIDIKNELKSMLSIEGKNLIFEGDWKNDYFDNLPFYLSHYYWWKIIESTDKKLIIEFTTFDIENFWKVFIENESYFEIDVKNEEINSFLWIDFDLLLLTKEFKRIWCNIEEKWNGYLMKVPSYKINIKWYKDVLWEIITFIFSNYKSNNKYYIEILKTIDKNGLLNKINYDIPYFFISNWFSELDLKVIWRFSENNLDTIFWENKKLDNYELKLTNNLFNWVISELLDKNPKLENKWFSIEKLWNGYNIIFYINCKEWNNELNKIYDYLVTISNILWIDKNNLEIDNELDFLDNWKSFTINNIDWETIWYLWKVSKKKGIKWDLYLCEITIKN